MGSSGGASAGTLPPAYGATSGLPYLPSRNVANFKSSNALKVRAAINGAAGGLLRHAAFVADSLAAGFNGNALTNDQEQAFPAQLLKYLVQNGAGILHGGVGFRSPAMAIGALGSGWAITGGVTIGLAPFAFTSTGGTITYTCPQAGSSVTLIYHGQSSAFSFTVGGGAVNNVNPTGTNGWESTTLGGQAIVNGTQIVITCGASMSFSGLRIVGASGLVCHNLGYGGAQLNSGSSGVNWCDFSAPTNLGPARLAGLPAGSVSAVFFEAGANDIDAGVSAATAAAGYQTLLARAELAGAAPFIITTWRKPTTTDAAWTAYLAQAYRIAALLDCPVIDWNDRVGGQVAAAANGYLGPDNVHCTYATNAAFGKAIGDLLLS